MINTASANWNCLLFMRFVASIFHYNICGDIINIQYFVNRTLYKLLGQQHPGNDSIE